MKITHIGFSGLFVFAFLPSFYVFAQSSISEKYADRYNNYDSVNNDTPGKLMETVHTFYEGHEYKIGLMNDRLTELYVDEVEIPSDKYAVYNATINRIKEQIVKDKIEESKDQTQTIPDQQQARKDQTQASSDGVQVHSDQSQAVKVHEKSSSDERMMNNMIADLIKDGIVPDQKSLYSITLSSIGMTVNGKMQPDTIYARYKEKYSEWTTDHFSYGGNQQSYTGIHLDRR